MQREKSRYLICHTESARKQPKQGLREQTRAMVHLCDLRGLLS